MAVAFDAVTTGTYENQTSVTINHTASGADRVALACINNTPSTSISSVTYGGSAMTSVATIVEATYDLRASIYRFIAPATSSQACVITWAAATYGVSAVESFTGVHQTTPISNSATADGDSDTPSVVVTSATDELVVDTVSFYDGVGSGDTVPGAGQTERFDLLDSFGDSGAGSTEAGAASVTMNWTLNVSVADRHWAQVACSLAVAAAALVHGWWPRYPNPIYPREVVGY